MISDWHFQAILEEIPVILRKGIGGSASQYECEVVHSGFFTCNTLMTLSGVLANYAKFTYCLSPSWCCLSAICLVTGRISNLEKA